MPAKLLALLPLLMASELSLKLLPNTLLTVLPSGFIVSSLMADSVALPLATGASLIAVIVSPKVTVPLEYAVLPPLLLTLSISPVLRVVEVVSIRRAVSVVAAPL